MEPPSTDRLLFRAVQALARENGWHITDRWSRHDREFTLTLRADTEPEPGNGRPDPA